MTPHSQLVDRCRARERYPGACSEQLSVPLQTRPEGNRMGRTAMKILYVSPYPPARDGIGDYTHNLANAVQKAGNEIRVVVPYAAPKMPKEVIGNLPVLGYRNKRLLRSVSLWNPDIIHVQFAIAGFGTRTIALLRWLKLIHRNLSVPTIVTLHEVARESVLLGALGHAIHRRIARHSTRLILHSDIALEQLKAEVRVGDNIMNVIPHPTAPCRAASSSEQELRIRFKVGQAKILLAFGFINVEKGFDDLVQALAIIRSREPETLSNVCLVIAGEVRPRHGLFRIFEARDGIYRARLVRAINRTSLQRNVALTGYVPDGEVTAWFNMAEAVILPYRSAEYSGVESLARSLNVPVLASNVGGLAVQLAGSQWIFPPRSPSHIADTLSQFLATEPPDRKHLSSAPDPADMQAVTARTLNMYASVTSDRLVRASNEAGP